MLVSVSVLTPLTYAQENLETLPEVVEDDVIDLSNEKGLKEEPEREEVEWVVEEVDTSLIDITAKRVSEFEEENQQELVETPVIKVEKSNEEEINEEETGEKAGVQAPTVKTIIYDADKWIIKLKIGDTELRIKDKNEGAENSVLDEKSYQLRLLMKKMCYMEEPIAVVPEAELTAAQIVRYVCSDDFSWTSLWIENVNTYESWMEYIQTHYNFWTGTYGNYYRWGNTSWYAKYEELSCQQNTEDMAVLENAIGQNSLENCNNLIIADDAKERWFMNMSDLTNTWWFEWYYDNPCDASKWEYLPSPDDWWQLVDMWWSIRWKNNTAQMPRSANFEITDVSDFMPDLMIPNAWIVKSENMGIENTTKGLLWVGWLNKNLYYNAQPNYLWSSRWHSYGNPWGLILYYDLGYYWNLEYESANPVRCFVVPEDQRATVKLVDWNEEETIITQKWKVIWEPEVNVAEWWFFMGWYDEDWNKFDFTDPINDDVVLHATWWKIEYNTWDITYTDTNGKVFSGIWTITITYGDKSITMLDRNLWAKSSGAWCVSGPEKFYNEPESNSCVSDYWYHFQWWNNYGFAMDENPEIWTGYADTSSNKWNNPYVSEIFGKDIDWNNYWWWDKPLNNSLWWWENEDNSDYMRQWPCPENYHVPSVEEWNKVLEYLANIRWYDLQYEDGLAYYWDEWMDLDREVLEEFTRILGIPNAGYRDYNWFPEGFFDFLAEFWTSSPSNSKVAMLTLTQEYLDWFWTLATVGLNWAWDRSVGNSVRCFADTYEEWEEPLVLYYDTDEGSAIQAQTIPAGENGYLPGYTTHRNDDENFLGWFNEDMTKEYILSGGTFTNLKMSEDLAADGVVTVYAKWWYKVTFYDYDGKVLNVQAVLSGKSAVPPTDPSRNGYTFSGWNADITNVTWDMEVTAQYTEKPSWGNSGWSSSWWWGGWWSSTNKTDTTKEEKTNEDTEKIRQTEQTPAEPQEENNTQKSQVTPQWWQNSSQWSSTYSEESQEAYKFAYKHWITTKPTIEEANMDGPLTRIQMAKMLSQYAINVLGKKPNTSIVAKFNDVTGKRDIDYNNWVTLAYQLWIMWINMPNNKFRPDDIVTRWEFVTAFSRMLFNTSDWEYKSTPRYYVHHMEKLKNEWIVTKDNPKMEERRWYVMIMLMRSVTK